MRYENATALMTGASSGVGREFATALAAQSPPPSIVVDCAGVGAYGPFTDAKPDEVAAQTAVNVTALTEITQAFLPALLTAAEPALVNVASLTGFAPTPGMAVYAATEAYVLSFTEALAFELRDTAVRVVSLVPGPTSTEFYETSNSSPKGVRFQTPADVVATGPRALDTTGGPVTVISGARNRLSASALRLLPRRAALSVMAGPTRSSAT